MDTTRFFLRDPELPWHAESVLHRRTKTSSKCRLLALPLELRRAIYNFVFARQGPVFLYGTIPEPPLLLTCSTIRQEASPLYYTNTTFRVPLYDFDPHTALRLVTWRSGIYGSYGLYPADLTFHVRPRPHWLNLLAWLKVVHVGHPSVAGLGLPSEPEEMKMMSIDALLVCGMFRIVEEMRDRPFERVVGLLREQRDVLVRVDGRWG
jgi:hypothetical protein